MSLDQETIDQQIELLAAHRRTLFHLLIQQAQFSAGHVPAHIAQGVAGARTEINYIKAYLRKHGTPVRDGRNDEALPLASPATTEAARKSTEEQHALDAVLETYISSISELLIDKNLLHSQPNDIVRQVARTRTLTVLQRLDSEHNQRLIQFLQDADLLRGEAKPIYGLETDLGEPTSIIVLREANLRGCSLRGANLARASLGGADLREADLRETNLYLADLLRANLYGADLRGANLHGADLRGANLREADLQDADLQSAYLYGATMPYGNKHS